MAAGDPCSLCELPCGRSPVVRTFDRRELAFCCMGCANVYSILLESGAIASGQNIRETEVFRRSLELGLISTREDSSQPKNRPHIQIDPQAPTQEVLLQVSGMWCSSCSWLIEHALRRLPGVVSAEVFFASDLAKVTFCPQYLPPDRIPARIAELGYQAAEYDGENTASKAEARDLLLRLGVAAFLWANIMGFSTILYVGYFEPIAASASRVLPFILLLLATPLVFYCAWPILRSAAVGVRNGQLRMESLLTLGIMAAYGLSAANAFRGQSHLYFDTAAAIVTLVLTGKLIERAAKDRASRAVALLYRLMPKKVRVLSSAGERFVSVEALEPGQIFVVKAGERIPADGVVVEGETYADESLLSGEAAPVAKRAGDQVASGSLNAGGVIHVRAVRTSGESTLAQIIRLVERAMSRRAPIERTVDHFSRVFVPTVILLAVGDFAVLVLLHAGVGPALMRATTILVIACPCALGLATPLAITAAVGSASRAGLLIADSRALETMGVIDTMILDKTGTVTEGDFRLVDFAALDVRRAAYAQAAVGAGGTAVCEQDEDSGVFFEEYLPVLAAVEAYSEHLLGRAVVQFAQEHHTMALEASGVEIRKGEGICGTAAGCRVFVGTSKFMATEVATPGLDAVERAQEWQQMGRTVVFFGWDGEVRGLLAFGDSIKPAAAEMVEFLRRRGIATKLVSGDAWPTTESVARQIGIEDFIGEATPADKARIVEELQRAGKKVAMLGDGVNDAPALAQADLGIALGTGADIAMNSAPIVLVSGSLAKVEEAFRLAAKTTQVVRQNLFWAFFYNAVGITLAVSGVLTPIFAAGAMLISSTSVIVNSMRVFRQEKA